MVENVLANNYKLFVRVELRIKTETTTFQRILSHAVQNS